MIKKYISDLGLCHEDCPTAAHLLYTLVASLPNFVLLKTRLLTLSPRPFFSFPLGHSLVLAVHITAINSQHFKYMSPQRLRPCHKTSMARAVSLPHCSTDAPCSSSGCFPCRFRNKVFQFFSSLPFILLSVAF